MTLIDFVGFLERELGVKVYPIQFPIDGNKDCLVVDVVISRMGVVDSTTIQLMARSKHPSGADGLLTKALRLLHNKTNLEWGENQIIHIKSRNTCPYFLGQDDLKNYVYNAQIVVLHSYKNN